MSILRSENDNVVSLLKLLTKVCINKTNKIEMVSIRKFSNTTGSLTEAILNTYYKDLLNESLKDNKNTKGLIKLKPDSWLNLIDLTKYTDNMERFNLPPVNNDIINKIIDRLQYEIDLYRRIANDDIKQSITNINNYKNSIEPAKALTDLFALVPVKNISTIELLRDKGLLTTDVTKSILKNNSDFKIIPTMKDVLLTLDTIDNDPE